VQNSGTKNSEQKVSSASELRVLPAHFDLSHPVGGEKVKRSALIILHEFLLVLRKNIANTFLNIFGNLQNFRRTNTFRDNAVRKFYGATRLATNRFKCRCTIKLSIARLTIRFSICNI
jgi:hypothetical protein